MFLKELVGTLPERKNFLTGFWGDLDRLSRLLGHIPVRTTEIYLNSMGIEMSRGPKQLSPLSRMGKIWLLVRPKRKEKEAVANSPEQLKSLNQAAGHFHARFTSSAGPVKTPKSVKQLDVTWTLVDKYYLHAGYKRIVWRSRRMRPVMN